MADPRLNVKFTSDLSGLRSALQSALRELDSFAAKAEKAGRAAGNAVRDVSDRARDSRGRFVGGGGRGGGGGGGVGGFDFRGIQKANEGLRTAQQLAYRLGAALGAAFSVQRLAAMSDEAGELNARLKLATRGTTEFNRAQAETFAIAQRTRTSYKATAELYARIERSTRDLALNQATILQLTETINQAAQLSGGGQGAEAALFQLSQGLAAGELRGEELNSVLEQTPRLAQAIADGMGIPVGKLRELAAQGQITAAAVSRALLKTKDDVAKEFAELPPTIAGGFTQIRNSFLQYLTTSTEAQTAARQVAEGLKLVADNMPAVISAAITLAKVTTAYMVLFRALPALYAAVGTAAGALAAKQMSLVAAFVTAGTAGQKAMLGLRAAANVALAAFTGREIGTYLREQFVEVERFGIAMVQGLLTWWERLKGGARIAGAFIRNAFTEPLDTIRAAFELQLAGIAEALEELGADKLAGMARKAAAAIRPAVSAYRDEVEAIARETAQTVANIEREFGDMAEAALEARRKAAGAAGAGGSVGVPDGASPAAKFRADLELLKDSIDRSLAELDRLYEDGEIGLREYYRRKRELQEQAIATAIDLARVELAAAKDAEARAKVLVEIEKLQRDRADLARLSAREQAKAEKELARSLEDVRDRIAELQGDTTASARRAIEREREELLRKFKDDPEAAQWIEKLFNVETARAQLNAIRDQVQQTTDQLRGTESLVAAQQDAGQLSPESAERVMQDLRARSIEQLREYREALAALPEAASNPEIIRALQEVDTEITRISASMNRMKLTIADRAIDGLTQFFTDVASRSKSAGEALRDFVVGFVQSMAQIAARAMATFLVLQMLDAIYPGLGKMTAAAVGTTAQVKHDGGLVGYGAGRSRNVDPALFIGAPRYHDGGIAGLRPGEVPAILERGEQVLSKGDPNNVMNGGGRSGPGTGTRVINVVDPSLVQDYLDTPDGEEAILNVIGRNPGRVRQMVS